jgi:hypothetical protein
MNIELTADEISQAVSVASRRRISCLFGRKKPQHYDEPSGNEWATEIESCCAEMAVCKHFGVYWTGGVFNGERAEHDARRNRQVRHTVYGKGHLPIYPEDNNEDTMILVTGKAPTYCIQGWINVKKAKQEQFWKEPPKVKCACWWVPQSSLSPIPENF